MTRILGLDYGTRRVGAAVSDPGHSIATPLEVYERRRPDLDAAHYRALIREHDVDRIVIGLPLHTRGTESESSAQARRWGAWLASISDLPVVYFDERYTSVDAEDVLRSAGVKLRNRKDKRDMLAARILLQNYLDSGSPLDERPPSSLTDEPRQAGGHIS
ncbi:Holliday junction resolvase RuvX [Tundrisphaera lichenicola]|uniref:Holliday junction resolvase RuvX n=1 Tax=Tundrisphaera lichenicola TaxID=2029860 RepID=UPI003EBF8443